MINYSNYEKITDNIMLIANKILLKMNVSLAYYSNDNKRFNFHREVKYHSNKTNENLYSIKRNFDYYLSIEHMNNDNFIRIGITEIIKLRYALNEAYKFFVDPKYKNLYVKKDGELIMYMNPDPILITGLPMDKYLQFEPSIYIDFRGEAQRGLRMYLSSKDVYCDISLNRLEAFKYTIDTINLFESAQLMINYIQRPEYGFNLYSYNTELSDEADANFQGKDNRKIQSQKGKSFFDRMNELE